MGFLAAALLLCVVRGPRETRWVGWAGGWQIRKEGDVAKKPAAEAVGDEEKGEMAGGGAGGGESDSADGGDSNTRHVDEKGELEMTTTMGGDEEVDRSKRDKDRDTAMSG